MKFSLGVHIANQLQISEYFSIAHSLELYHYHEMIWNGMEAFLSSDFHYLCIDACKRINFHFKNETQKRTTALTHDVGTKVRKQWGRMYVWEKIENAIDITIFWNIICENLIPTLLERSSLELLLQFTLSWLKNFTIFFHLPESLLTKNNSSFCLIFYSCVCVSAISFITRWF